MPWNGEERRQEASLGQPHDLTLAHIEALLSHDRKDQREHFDAKLEELSNLFKSGFPGGDPVEHRKVHESYIREAQERSAMWKSFREKLISGGTLGFLGVVGGLIYWVGQVAWEAFKRDFLK